jgi:Ca2+-binding EF-hand superfamily protein
MTAPTVLLLALAATLSLAAPVALAKDAPNAGEFAAMDANKDGEVSSGEHEDYARKLFVMVDTNQDQEITAAELDAADSKLTTYSGGNANAATVIRRRDTNGDGAISQTEQATGARDKFIFLDANNNGSLTEQEYASGG